MAMELADWVGLLSTLFILAVVPGSTDAVIVARSLQSGSKAGLAMVLGVVVADLVFVLIAVFSLQLLLNTLGPLFLLVRLGMAVWLAHMGWLIWRSRGQPPSVQLQANARNDFFRGFFLTLADPKAIVFYMGLLPAFMSLSPLYLPDLVGLLLAVTVGVGTVKALYVLLATQARHWLGHGQGLSLMQSVSAIVVWACAVLLLLRPAL
nr:LysE family translocator [Oceanococcus sp. HetDA_MAG_MS8]